MFFELYWHSYVVVCIVCMLIVAIIYKRVNNDFGTKIENTFFKCVLVSYSFYNITNALLVPSFLHGFFMLYFLNTINTISILLCLFFWVMFVESKFRIKSLVLVKFSIIFIPLLLLIIGIIANPFAHWFYYLNNNKEIVRGDFYFLLLFINVFYFFIITLDTIQEIKKHQDFFSQFMRYCSFYLFPLAAGLVDFFWGAVPILELIIVFVILHVFIFIQTEKINLDALTKINNRRKTEEFLDNIFKNKIDATCVICDIDKFKSINDTHGHICGDLALKIVANSLTAFADNEKCFISRWGGDEFLIIFKYRFVNIERLQNTINRLIFEKLNEEKAPFNMTLSFGYAYCSECKDKKEFLHKADNILYKNKQLR